MICIRPMDIRTRNCWVRCRHCSNYKARGASGNYKAWGASSNYKARGASGGKYKARMMIFRILAAVNRFSRIFWKAVEENQKTFEESGKPLKKAESP
jgi:hypothetical protein